jgi:hypothetical protein
MSPGGHSARLFINYRREDSAPYAGRLYDRLTAHFGAEQVFIDIDKILPGEDFVEAINRKVAACEIAIVSIGPNWLRITDANGKRRLDDKEDFVRMEIVAALERNIRVIPILLGGAQMPRKEELPDALAPLSRRNAIEVSETRFHSDVDRLIKAIEQPRSSPWKATEAPTENLRRRPKVHLPPSEEKQIADSKYHDATAVHKRAYLRYAILLLLFAAVVTLGIKWWKNPPQIKSTFALATFFGDARRSTPPCSDATVAVIRDLTTQLKEDFSPSNRNRPDAFFYSWTEAQMVVALEAENVVDAAEMSQWFNAQIGKASAWQFYSSGPEQFGVTGWVLLAFARMNVKPMEQQIEFVVRNQQRSGWWSMCPASNDLRNASTYATAMCTWGLAELFERNLIAHSQKEAVHEAVRRGREWLQSNTVRGQAARWKDYPHGDYGRESMGLSGLVLHVLHHTPGSLPEAGDRYWMANLPTELPDPKDESTSGQQVFSKDFGVLNDPTHQFALPWFITATADAFGRGTLTQRAQAARLFNQLPEKRETIARDLKPMPHAAAELLISLRHLQQQAAYQRQP